jgi:hypothetical protein
MLTGISTYSQYSWIKKDDYKKITATQQNFYFYDVNGANPQNWATKKEGENILVADRSWSTCTLETEKVTKKELKTRRPDRRLLEAFDKEVNQITNEIAAQILVIENHRKEKLEHLQNNLFIDRLHSNIVEENLHDTVHQLQDLKLEVEKIKAYYDGLE